MTALLLVLLAQMPGVQIYDEGIPKGQAARLNCVGGGITCWFDGGVGQVSVGLGAGLTSDGGVISSTDTCTGVGPCKIGGGGMTTDGGLSINRATGTGPALDIFTNGVNDMALSVNGGHLRIVEDGYCFGGYESCFGPFGLVASAQGHRVDANEAQNVSTQDGLWAGIVDYAYTPDAGQVSIRVGNSATNTDVKLLQVCTNASPDTCTEKAYFDGTGLGVSQGLAAGGIGISTDGGISFGTSISLGTSVMDSANAPTISSGFGTSPSIVSSNGTAAFTINVGTGGTASSGVIAFATAAAHRWCCHCDNVISGAMIEEGASLSSTTYTVFNRSIATASITPWISGDQLDCTCRGQ